MHIYIQCYLSHGGQVSSTKAYLHKDIYRRTIWHFANMRSYVVMVVVVCRMRVVGGVARRHRRRQWAAGKGRRGSGSCGESNWCCSWRCRTLHVRLFGATATTTSCVAPSPCASSTQSPVDQQLIHRSCCVCGLVMIGQLLPEIVQLNTVVGCLVGNLMMERKMIRETRMNSLWSSACIVLECISLFATEYVANINVYWDLCLVEFYAHIRRIWHVLQQKKSLFSP